MTSEPTGVPPKPQFDYRNVELRSLFELSQILNSSLDVDRVLNNCLLTPMGRMMISKGFALSVNDRGGFVIRVVKGLPKSLLGEHLKFTYNFPRPLYIQDMNENECQYKDFFLKHGITLLVPVTSTNRMVGALCLGPKMTNEPFSKREIEFLNSLSNMAATSIENALMFQQLKDVNRRLDKKVQELNTLFDVGKELNSTLDKQKMTNILLYTIMGEMAVTKIMVLLKEDGDFQLTINRGFESNAACLELLSDDALLARLSKLAVPTLLSAESKDSDWHALHHEGVRLLVPLRIQDDTNGVLVLGPKMSQHPYVQDELEIGRAHV